jgi:hypothetical protein
VGAGAHLHEAQAVVHAQQVHQRGGRGSARRLIRAAHPALRGSQHVQLRVHRCQLRQREVHTGTRVSVAVHSSTANTSAGLQQGPAEAQQGTHALTCAKLSTVSVVCVRLLRRLLRRLLLHPPSPTLLYPSAYRTRISISVLTLGSGVAPLVRRVDAASVILRCKSCES